MSPIRAPRTIAGDKGGASILFSGIDALWAPARIGAGGCRQDRVVQRAYGYCSTNGPRVHFGLVGTGRVDEVEGRGPNRGAKRFGPHEACAVRELLRGPGRPAD